MEEGKVPIPVVWPHGGSEVYVTGDFNSYSLLLLTGEKDKFCVIWCSPGTCIYRFLVDGSYMCDKTKPTIASEGTLYNFIEVVELPQPISNLHLLSLEELENLDNQLFANPQQEIEKRIHKAKAFLRRVVQRKKFLYIKNAAIRIQSWIKAKRQRKKYLEYLEYLHYKKKTFEDKEMQTDEIIDEEKEQLKKLVAELTEENEKLQKNADAKQALEAKKKNQIRKVEPPLISIKAFMTPSKPISFRDMKVDLTPKNKNSISRLIKK